MRFFRYSLVFSLLIVTITLGIFLSIQEWVLFQANNQLLKAVGVAQKSRQGSEYYEYCRNLGTVDISDSPMYFTQLRFISDTEYITEVLCDQYEFAPKEISRNHLPLFATKKPGQSGFVFLGEGTWSVAIQAVPTDIANVLEKIPVLKSVFFSVQDHYCRKWKSGGYYNCYT